MAFICYFLYKESRTSTTNVRSALVVAARLNSVSPRSLSAAAAPKRERSHRVASGVIEDDEEDEEAASAAAATISSTVRGALRGNACVGASRRASCRARVKRVACQSLFPK